MSQPKIKAVFFDFMGTCLDWHGSVVKALLPTITQEEASKLALEWRRQYFLENSNRVSQNLHPEDIDITLAHTLEVVLDQSPEHQLLFDSEAKAKLIQAWHAQKAWPEVSEAIKSLRIKLGLEVFVHANGTTRLQLDLTRSSGLDFNMLFSSQLLGSYKPNPEAYQVGLQLVKLQPEEVVLVAAHAYDLRGAKKCGLRTVYVHRWTDDIDENMDEVRGEFDAFLDNMDGLADVIAGL
ncbi:Haloacid dehalogenase type II [Penicillium soppii]|jgi:2-haloalkanoic acid dehalogenase type II|uniref:Haloacid dehalogenase type II n=1 Tax=Penicillium soppii TaxID=69789 RepID=UPI0025479C02|nr:Haloacid dehalogenase type II [Penicillium soppii]KAJ5872389.1 Haloacid dehalogenase type II [Penicillium soppii]